MQHTYTRLRASSYALRAIIQAAITRSCRVHPFSGKFFPLPFPPPPRLSSHPPPPSPPPHPPPAAHLFRRLVLLLLLFLLPLCRSSLFLRRLAGDQPFFFANCHAVTVVISSYPSLNVRSPRVRVHIECMRSRSRTVGKSSRGGCGKSGGGTERRTDLRRGG